MSQKNNNIIERLSKLRTQLKEKKINGYIIPSNDEYMSEFTPTAFRRLEYITGFAGSNGIAVILEDLVLFFTDGRYLTQSKNELDSDHFKIFDIATIRTFNWSEHIITDQTVIGYDPKIFTMNQLGYFKSIKLKSVIGNLVDKIWNNRPSLPNSVPYRYDKKYAGQSSHDKLIKCRELLDKHHAEAVIITNVDSVCWLLNIRAHDLEYSPIFLVCAIITKDQVVLSRCHDNDKHIKEYVTKLGYDFDNNLDKLISNIDGKIIYDASACSSYLVNLLSNKNILSLPDPCQLWKAKNNNVEINYIANAHIYDAVAVCETLEFIINHSNIAKLSEYDISKILTENRAKSKLYKMDSFPAICGYQDNGAVIHYRPRESTAKKLSGSGLLLLDSGGQYLGGTTDVTRTIHIGSTIDPKYKHFYTLVLKCHIALATIKFPENKVTGANLDVLARQYLWSESKDYPHSPGHGVGAFMNVHEGPQAIAPRSFNITLQEGMVLSNEPGYYAEGKYGIRIENLMYVKNINSGYCCFEQLTLVPYAKNLIDFNMLSDVEILYLKDYYKQIIEKLLPLLSKKAKEWLKKEVALF